MKKDRNCGMMGYPQMVPGMMPMMPGYTNLPEVNYNNYESVDTKGITDRLNSLEQRVSKLESIVNNGYSNNYSNGYNSSNYQMM